MESYTDITIRQLRQVLTSVGDQSLTVSELRHILFDQPDQDVPAAPVLPYFVEDNSAIQTSTHR